MLKVLVNLLGMVIAAVVIIEGLFFGFSHYMADLVNNNQDCKNITAMVERQGLWDYDIVIKGSRLLGLYETQEVMELNPATVIDMMIAKDGE